MKKIIITLTAAALLSGCSVKIPFINEKPEEKAEQNPQLVERNEQTKENYGSNQSNEELFALEAAHFNSIKEVNGVKEIVNADNVLALVNKEFALPGTYIPEDLVKPNVQFSFGEQDIEKSYLRKEAAVALEKMFAAAENSNIYLFAVSGYRSYNRQVAILNNEIERVGKDQAMQAVAIPGKSEHQTGLAMDISSESVQYLLTDNFGETKEGKWLKENAHHFGFILRYPKDKEGITGYQFEPWHFRYVGEKNAQIMYKNNWTLEEFFKEVRKI
ncbi:D-alanyl-D-alanine carboxypeptidase family protein [Lederbergia wuyishanensis]|uniref:D-alanyl-D-alanine carboxypeptidase n=1 Tax=Lederbergia wuyishanensis TaxID=1347903 RepID=A0ABU0D0P4_9BACI|nr:D-alanyl-D-alanine carboxypeptidase family protein [Lederbergia wuyishanensis]MCJ8006595.1 D-alanyl-D-alanine carboxypeptidase family protein [Lederbergia wuyishanensis]MDQ0341976.1 D-alanyl-D-alanine carboxypeptidase [Lederbergia wuyishanensis]